MQIPAQCQRGACHPGSDHCGSAIPASATCRDAKTKVFKVINQDGVSKTEEAGELSVQSGFAVVGIGASAGGLIALKTLLEALPPSCGMALVVVMHLSPDHASMLGEILERSAKAAVVTVTGPTRIEADHIYVMAPSLQLTVIGSQLEVSLIDQTETRGRSIDHFSSAVLRRRNANGPSA